MQSFTLSAVLTNGGPARATTTLALFQYATGFRAFRFGYAGAVAALLLVVVGGLGLAAGALVAACGLRLGPAPVGPFVPARKSLAALAVALLPVSVVIIALGLVPALWAGSVSLKTGAEALRAPGAFFPAEPTVAAYGRFLSSAPVGRAFLNTSLPVAWAVICVQLPIAYLGALGIGALRPIGRWSEWLLLPFSPWLFVTAGPLSLALFERVRGAGALSSFLAPAPPLALNVPLLFLLTLFFKGHAPRWRAARDAGQPAGAAFFRALILPSLPLTLLLAAGGLLLGSQELLWPLVVANRQEYWTFPVLLRAFAGQVSVDPPTLAAAIVTFGLPSFAWAFLVLAPFQVFYLDRLALATGRAETVPPVAGAALARD